MEDGTPRAPRLRARGLLPWLALALLASTTAASGYLSRARRAIPQASEDVPSLEPTFATPDALASAVLEALEKEQGAALKSLALDRAQFRHYVWPQLPASRPERGLPFEYGWGDLRQKSHNALLRTYDRYKGRSLELLEIKFEDGVTDYETYLVHRDARVKVRLEDGRDTWLDLFGSVMEYEGRYKLFSYVTD